MNLNKKNSQNIENIENVQNTESQWPFKTIVTLIIIGYISTIFLIIVIYLFQSKRRHYVLNVRWFLCVTFVLFCMILFYSRAVRCIAAVCLPTLWSSKGRALLMSLAFFVAATSPTMNIMANLEILTRSLACGQTQLMDALENMRNILYQPILALEHALQLVVTEIRKVMVEVEKILLHIQELVLKILQTFKNCAAWLDDILSICRNEFGTPFERCMKIADEGMEKCRQKMGTGLDALCEVTKIFKALCHSVKFIDTFCEITWHFNNELIQMFMEAMRAYLLEIENMFEVSIKLEHDYYFDQHESRNLSEVGSDIVADISQRMRPIFMVFGWLNVVSTILFFMVLLKAIYFTMRYKHNLEYENVYLTKDFYAIEEERRKRQQTTVLPLKLAEKRKYIKLSSWRLLNFEMFLMTRHMLFMIISCIQLFCICLVDYSLYWLLATIAFHGSKQSDLDVPPYLKIVVQGEGFIPDIIRGITRAFEPMVQNYTIDLAPCIPKPNSPEYIGYIQILTLCAFGWFILLLEPYGLRLRHVIMRWYYPKRARRRALYLYDKLLMKRINFFKFARRKARANFLYKDSYNYNFMEWLRIKLKCRPCRSILGPSSEDLCTICGRTLTVANSVRCQTPGCKGVYCKNCFKKSMSKCCICQGPKEYGDYSDVSEVTDSSDDPNHKYYDESKGRCAPKNAPKQYGKKTSSPAGTSSSRRTSSSKIT